MRKQFLPGRCYRWQVSTKIDRGRTPNSQSCRHVLILARESESDHRSSEAEETKGERGAEVLGLGGVEGEERADDEDDEEEGEQARAGVHRSRLSPQSVHGLWIDVVDDVEH